MSNRLGRPVCECEAGEETRDHLHRSVCPVYTAYKARCLCTARGDHPKKHHHSCPNYDGPTLVKDQPRCT